MRLRLIAHAQNGENPTPDMASKRIDPLKHGKQVNLTAGPPFPTFEGIQLPTPPPHLLQVRLLHQIDFLHLVLLNVNDIEICLPTQVLKMVF